MGFTINIKVDGVTQLKQKLLNVSELPKDLTKVFKRVGQICHAAWGKNFHAQGRPAGWHRLQPSTIADRLAKGYQPAPIGIRSGIMVRDLMGNGINSINEIKKQSAAFGVKSVAAAVFNRGKFNQVSRPMLYLDRAELNAIVYEFRKEIKNTLRKKT